ncbi:MFS transporter [Streptosporangium algeriense]|uniref:MFS transporter n=1 Tax=Streptosporangium algeriense TaxID=1682748 RepID=A0ABW3DQ82_9ACTN
MSPTRRSLTPDHDVALGDRIGRRRLLLIGAVGSAAASVLGALASAPWMLILARALLGVAGATIMPSTLSIIRNMFLDRDQRRTEMAVWAAMGSAGAAAGFGMLLFLTPQTPPFAIAISLFLVGLGAGVGLTLTNDIIMSSARRSTPGRPQP